MGDTNGAHEMTTDRMGSSDAMHSSSEPMRNNGHIGSFSSATVPATAAAAASTAPASATSPRSDRAAPTKLTGLACNVHRTTGNEPHALVGATTTILGDKLYVFGGRILSRRRPHLTSDLYELDLRRRHWTKLDTTGDIPPPRYFHSVCALGDTKLVCYGGMSPASASKNAAPSTAEPPPEVMVMSDIHIYDVPSQTWMAVNPPETPQGRYAHCATILPSWAIFTSSAAPLSAIHNNPSSSTPHSGSIGVQVDGTGGAEMVVVGGQDSSNHYIEQISVFNLRSLRWTATSSLGRQCGAYRSVVTPLTGMPATSIGRSARSAADVEDDTVPRRGSSMLIYSNYNFLDVKLELQIRHPDGALTEKPMNATVSPPGLRFPNGGIIDHHFVVSGTYLTSSRQEYALWALDLRDLTWGRVDTGGAIFAQGSWNRGVLWSRGNTFVILGHRKRSLVEDYNQRRINFSHVCMVELQAFGLYADPRKEEPSSGCRSASSPAIPPALWPKAADQITVAPLSTAAESLGQLAVGLREMADMDLLALGGERIPVNSHLLSRRWGPYFNRLLRESCAHHPPPAEASLSLRPGLASQATTRSSAITITPTTSTHGRNVSQSTTLVSTDSSTIQEPAASVAPGVEKDDDVETLLEPPSLVQIPPSGRPRTLYLPHTASTIRAMLHYLHTNALPPVSSHLSSPPVLCSILQLAQPYEIDGLLEATIGRLHEVLDGRNAAAVLNASAMAAGGGRGVASIPGFGKAAHHRGGGRMDSLSNGLSDAGAEDVNRNTLGRTSSTRAAGLAVDTAVGETNPSLGRVRRENNHERSQSQDSAASASTAASAATSVNEGDGPDDDGPISNGVVRGREREAQIWTGEHSAVIGLQKRGLRGLMEDRMLREMRQTISNPNSNSASAGRVASATASTPGVDAA